MRVRQLFNLAASPLDDQHGIGEVDVEVKGNHAVIKVASKGTESQQNQVLAALEHASGYLRRELASRLQLRHVPELHFEHDKNPEADSRIDFLLRRAKKSRPRDDKQP